MAADEQPDRQDRREDGGEAPDDGAAAQLDDDRDPQAGDADAAEHGEAGTPREDRAPRETDGEDREAGEGESDRRQPDGEEAGAGETPDRETPDREAAGEAAEPEPEPGEGEGPPHRPARSGAAAGAAAAMADREAAPPEDLSADSFGSWLRRQREMREIDLREIAEQTKISLRYLKAMEQDRFDVLPAEVFARGFLKEYARYVGLNPDEVVNYYLSSHEEATDGEEPPETRTMTTESRGPVSKALVAALILLLLLAVALYLWFYQRSQDDGEATGEERPPMAAPVTAGGEPATAEPPSEPEPEPAPSAPLVVTLDFTQNCWVEARADDDRRISRLFAAGESLQLEAEEQVVLENLGNVDGVQVQVNGEPYDLPPAQGNSVRDVVIEAPEPPSPGTGGGGRPGATGPDGTNQGGTNQGGTGPAGTGQTGPGGPA